MSNQEKIAILTVLKKITKEAIVEFEAAGDVQLALKVVPVFEQLGKAIREGLVPTNPVTDSEPPKVKKHLAIALTPAQQDMIIASASGPWCMRMILEMDAATGCRR